MKKDNIDELNIYDIKSILNPFNSKDIPNNIFDNIPTQNKIDKKIHKYLTIPSYYLITIAICSLIFLCAFVATYVLHSTKIAYITTLSIAIIFVFIFFIGYFITLFLYSHFIKKQFHLLYNKFLKLKNTQILKLNNDCYPESLIMINYSNEPLAWEEKGKKIPKFSFYFSIITLIIFFNKLEMYIKQNEELNN